MDESTAKLVKLSIDDTAEEVTEESCLKWGLPLIEIYKISLKFFKGKIWRKNILWKIRDVFFHGQISLEKLCTLATRIT